MINFPYLLWPPGVRVSVEPSEGGGTYLMWIRIDLGNFEKTCNDLFVSPPTPHRNCVCMHVRNPSFLTIRSARSRLTPTSNMLQNPFSPFSFPLTSDLPDIHLRPSKPNRH